MFRHGMVIPFLGAGASFGARHAAEGGSEPTYLPSGKELAHVLAGRATPPFPSDDPFDLDDLAKVASWYVTNNSRPAMRVLLRDLLAGSYEPSPLHDLLAASPTPMLIFTTNYDTLAEEAFRRAGKPYDLVVYPADHAESANAVLWWEHDAEEPKELLASALDVDLETRSVIYKMHGTLAAKLHWDNFVITEDDYVRFLTQLAGEAAVPARFYEHFEDRNFLFLGYSLRDWNLRVVLHGLRLARQQTGVAESDAGLGWAIQKDPSQLERELWRFAAFASTTCRSPSSRRSSARRNDVTGSPSSPWVGLRPYTAEERAYFHGRERDVRILAANLRARRLTVVYGSTGAGKSSILLAGVVPTLREKRPVLVFRDWQSDSFLEELKQLCLDLAREHRQELDPTQPLDELLGAAARVAGEPVLVVLDQFEEYFAAHPAGRTATASSRSSRGPSTGPMSTRASSSRSGRTRSRRWTASRLGFRTSSATCSGSSI